MKSPKLKSPKLKVPKMEVDFFDNLPPVITIDILSRLPVQTIRSCKCVRKSWRDLLRTRDFADCHLSKSASGMVITSGDPLYGEVYEFVDDIDPEGHRLHYIPVTEFKGTDFTDSSEIQGSVDGLIFLGPRMDSLCVGHYICNPVTREYMSLPDCPNHDVVNSSPRVVNSGFGVSKSGEYKVVRVFHKCVRDPDPDTDNVVRITNSVCHIYTLGTRKWRSIADCAPLANDYYSIGAFLNGSLYWLVTDFKGSNLIYCFDLESEIFSTFSAPPPLSRKETCYGGLVSLGDCLCMFDNSTSDDEVVIWSMKENGDEKTWTKDFVLEGRKIGYPIIVFTDSDILMVMYYEHMFYYSKETKYRTRIDELGEDKDFDGVKAIFHRLSFISLRSCFPTEIVRPL